jgi:hypothetical protein
VRLPCKQTPPKHIPDTALQQPPPSFDDLCCRHIVHPTFCSAAADPPQLHSKPSPTQSSLAVRPSRVPHRLSAFALVAAAGEREAHERLLIMSSFITNLFPSSQGGKHDNIMPVPPPPLHTRSSQNESFNIERPNTPNRNSFITPVSTPQGSPSKNRNPPGANDLPVAFESSLKLTPNTFGSPTKGGRSQAGTPLSLGKSNALAIDDSYFGNSPGNIDDSIIHKSAAISPGSPLRKQGKENTPPTSRQGLESSAQNQAAISRQELYQPRERQPTRGYNTQRGLTADELEILSKPNVKRLANVTQLCKYG